MRICHWKVAGPISKMRHRGLTINRHWIVDFGLYPVADAMVQQFIAVFRKDHVQVINDTEVLWSRRNSDLRNAREGFVVPGRV